MAKRPFRPTDGMAGKTMDVAMDYIDGDTLEIIGIQRSAITQLSLEDEARIQTIERRIASGARRVSDVMTRDERAWLESIGAEARVNFALKDGRRVEVRNGVDGSTLGALAKKQKPKPTLADDLLFTKSRTLIDPRVNDFAKSLLRSSSTKRFVLTESAAIKIGEAIRAYPEMLVEHGWFARTPLPTCWIELPAPAFHNAIVPGYGTPAQDDRVGYLFHGNQVYVGASNPNENGADLSPMVYQLHRPNTLAEQLDLTHKLGVSRAQLDNFFWGATMADNLSRDTLRGLREQHGFSIAVDPRYRDRIRGDEWLGFSAGEVRNIIGLLLMINQPANLVQTTEVARQKRMTRRGNQVLMSHTVVTLNLDRRSKPDRLLRKPVGSHASPRWHNVVDHWCNDKVARASGYSLDDPKTHGRGDHVHLWDKEERPNGALVATCAICGGKRWRRFMRAGRGDRSKGTIQQTRVVGTDVDRQSIRDMEREYA